MKANATVPYYNIFPGTMSETEKKADAASSKPVMEEEEEENVFMFVPNLIGYGRIFLGIVSFW